MKTRLQTQAEETDSLNTSLNLARNIMKTQAEAHTSVVNKSNKYYILSIK